MNRFGILLCLVILLAGAAVHGAATRRWEVVAPAVLKADRLHAMTVRVGDYEATKIEYDLPIKERSVVTCYRYDSAALGQMMVVSLTSGIPGAVATHTPDVCYVGSGYKITRGPTRRTVELPGGGTARFFVADFEKTTATGIDRQRVRWAWTADGNWDAPDYPRFAYFRAGELFKLYVVTRPADDAPAQDSETVTAFTVAAFEQYARELAR
ncbi:MAG TPA: hypothetical protein VGJ05_09630 [Fimbriiglobus sp.]|jgi:hypothetical protein